MTTLDLSKVPESQWDAKIAGALSTVIEQKITAHTLNALKSRERGLQAELNDVRERIARLECAVTRFPNAA